MIAFKNLRRNLCKKKVLKVVMVRCHAPKYVYKQKNNSSFSRNLYVLRFFVLRPKGASLNYVGKILPIFDPPLRRQVYYISLCSSIGN